MKHLQQRFEVSERRACRVVDQSRVSSQRYVSTKAGKDAAVVERLIALSTERTRAMASAGCGPFSEGRAGQSTKSVSRGYGERQGLRSQPGRCTNEDVWESPRMAARGDVPSTSTTSGPTTLRWTLRRMGGG